MRWGHLHWDETPELDLGHIEVPSTPGLTQPRVSGFAECDGVLFAAIGHQILRRDDGASPHWRVLYTNPKPGHSETGLRGLTAVANPSGAGEALLAAVEGTIARFVRVDPATGAETTELDLQAALDRAWKTKTGYAIAAYNDMTKVRNAKGATQLLIGLEVALPKSAPLPAGHAREGLWDSGAWYLVRRADARYELHQIAPKHPRTDAALVATRAIAVSPFADGRIFFGGFDANKVAAHNTAWILDAPKAHALARGEPLVQAPSPSP